MTKWINFPRRMDSSSPWLFLIPIFQTISLEFSYLSKQKYLEKKSVYTLDPVLAQTLELEYWKLDYLQTFFKSTHSQYAFYGILSAFVQYWSCKKFSPFPCNICLCNQITNTHINFLSNLNMKIIRLKFLWHIFLKSKTVKVSGSSSHISS